MTATKPCALWLVVAGCAPSAELPEIAVPAQTERAQTGAAVPKPRELGVTVERTRIACAEDRCLGELRSNGQIDFEQIDPATRIVFGSSEARGLTDLGGDRSPRYRLEPPDLGALFESQPLESLLVLEADARPAAVLPITLRFPDLTTARGSLSLSRTALRNAFFDRMRSVTTGPVVFPSDDAHSGPPRAMWVQLPLGSRGTARSINELDWVLVLDEPSRSIECERQGGGVGTKAAGKAEKQTFFISDERARIYERRTGHLVGEKTIPTPTPDCASLFANRDRHIGGVMGFRDMTGPKWLADWAWNTLR